MKTRVLLQTACVLAVTVFIANFSTTTSLAQGSLIPPGPPAAGMLTLTQVQPRTPVDAIHTPGTSTSEFTITNSGSYYLTTNIFGVSGKDAIDIATNNVTLDLNGFSLLGATTGGSFNFGVQIFTCTNITVHNGAISGWGGHGIFSEGNNLDLEHLFITGNANFGIVVQNVSTIKYCMTSANKIIGIVNVASGSLIADNVCSGDNSVNEAGAGGIIIIGNNNRIENNHVTETGVGYGIGIESGSSTNNIFIRNSVEGLGANDYSINSLQVVGPIITNTVSGIITNSNPWANFGF